MFPEIYIRKLKYEEAKKKLLLEIENLFFQGISEASIIHGIGNYILRDMVVQEIAKLDYVEIREAAHFNPGELRIRLLIPSKEVLKSYYK